MTRRTLPARVISIAAKRPPVLAVEVAGGEVDPRAVAELERLLAEGRAMVRDRDERTS